MIRYKSSVEKIDKKDNKLIVNAGGKKYSFDKVICTLPSTFFVKITRVLNIFFLTPPTKKV